MKIEKRVSLFMVEIFEDEKLPTKIEGASETKMIGHSYPCRNFFL